MIEIAGKSLTRCQVAADGSTIRLNFESTCGQPASITLPADCIQQLLMTLPHVASMAIQARHRDETLRFVFPLAQWKLEEAAGSEGALILTLATTDSIEVAFSVARGDMGQIARAVEAQPARTRDRPVCH